MKDFLLKCYIATLSDAEKLNICAGEYASAVRDATLKEAIEFPSLAKSLSLKDATFLALKRLAKQAPNLPN